MSNSITKKHFENIREDWRRNRHNYKFLLILTLFRIGHVASVTRKKSKISWFWTVPYLVFYRFITEWVFGLDLPPATVIGKGLIIDHGYSVVINKHTVIGDYCRIRHCVTIGCNVNPDGTQGPSPIIGDNVEIGVHVAIIGQVTIGNNVIIGAGTIVLKDVPPNTVVVGNPARIIRINDGDVKDSLSTEIIR